MLVVVEIMTIVKFAIIHIHIPIAPRVAGHQFSIAHTRGAIVIRRVAPALLLAFHQHSAQREVIVFGGMQRHTGTREQIVAHTVVALIVILIFAGLQILLFTLATARIGTMTEAHVQIGIEQRTVVIDIKASVATATGVGTHLHRTVITRLTVFLQHDVDDTGRTFSGIFCRRIVYHLYMIYALGRHLLQYLSTVVGGQSARFTVYPHLHTGVAPQ